MTLASMIADFAHHAPRAGLIVAATVGLGGLSGWVWWLVERTETEADHSATVTEETLQS